MKATVGWREGAIFDAAPDKTTELRSLLWIGAEVVRRFHLCPF